MPSWVPRKYMKKAVRFGLEHACVGLLMDPGLGKTSTSLATFQILREEGLVSRALVIAPLRPAYDTWPAESAKWDEFADLKVSVLHGPKKADLLDEPHDISVINPEGLEWLLGWTDDDGARHTGAIDERDWFWDMLIVDESSKFKHTQTVRFRTLKPHLPKFSRRIILTGSPAANGLLDLYGQIFILDLGNALGRHMSQYKNRYFKPTGFGGYTWVPKKDADRDIYRAVAPLTLRMAAADHLDLPPLVENVVRLDLPPTARRAYEQMESLMLLELEGELITAANAAAVTMKCRQVANGGIYTDTGAWKHIHQAKTEAVTDMVDELNGRPAFIAYEFKHDLERLQRALPGVPHIGGGVTPKDASEIVRRWNRGELRALLAQPQSVAHGLNLQGVPAHVLIHSLTWDLEIDEQFIRRIWRQGQKETTVVHRFVARDTVDEVILAAIRRKDRTQRALLSALRDYANARRTLSDKIPTLKSKRARKPKAPIVVPGRRPWKRSAK